MGIDPLFPGLVFLSGVFAVKGGIGLSPSPGDKPGLRVRPASIAAFIIGYALIFALARAFTGRPEFLAYMKTATSSVENGTALYLLLAFLLLLWSAALLRGNNVPAPASGRGRFILALPCPASFIVIVLSGVFLQGLLPDVPWLFAWFFAAFIAAALASGLFFSYRRHNNPGRELGVVMALAALYFLAVAVVAPQLGDIERIYRLSRGGGAVVPDGRHYLLIGGLSLFFAAGFIRAVWRSSWK